MRLDSATRKGKSMAHNAVDRSPMELESMLWNATRMYVTGKIDIKKLEEVEREFTEVFNNAMVVISKRNLSNNLWAKVRKILKLKS